MLMPAPDAPREEHEAYAHANGYFWSPCPRCGRFFGGHEISGRRGGHWWTSPSEGKLTCPECPGDYNTEARDGPGEIPVLTIPLMVVPHAFKKGTKPS